MNNLTIVPVTIKEACAFIKTHHRHHRPPQGALFAVAVAVEDRIVGVATVGRPVSRILDATGWTAEITRVCTVEGAPMGAASKLYSRSAQIAQLMGYRRVISYILVSESGVSLKAAGWKEKGPTGGGSWTRPSRPRVDTHPLEQKTLWEQA